MRVMSTKWTSRVAHTNGQVRVDEEAPEISHVKTKESLDMSHVNKILLHTIICNRCCCNWRASCVATEHTKKTWMSRVTHTNRQVNADEETPEPFFCYGVTMITGWRRLIGSPMLQIILHKRAIKYRSLLQKMTYKDKGSYESSPPCSRLPKNIGP